MMMRYKNLRDFIALLKNRGELKRISQEIDPYLEMTEISEPHFACGRTGIIVENRKDLICRCCAIYSVRQSSI